MSYTIIKKLPPIEKMIQDFPLSKNNYEKIQQDRKEIKNILSGQDPRLLMIVGPCSAWPKEAVLDYAEKLLKIHQKVKHVLKLVMRVYIQKPRTTKGWTGPLNQPNPYARPDIETGIKYTRDMMIKIIQMGLPIADEALFIHNAKGFLELLSWTAIGARSTENPEHRIFASAVDCAVGLKNPTHGSLTASVNSVVAAQQSHVSFFDGHEIQTHGNPYAHLVLRGSNKKPNYTLEHIEEIKKNMTHHRIQNPAIIIDASHDNCFLNGEKHPHLQIETILHTVDQLNHHPELKALVKGFMVESFIKEGKQKIHEKNPEKMDLGGLSITDPCLGWENTEKLLLHLADLQEIPVAKKEAVIEEPALGV